MQPGMQPIFVVLSPFVCLPNEVPCRVSGCTTQTAASYQCIIDPDAEDETWFALCFRHARTALVCGTVDGHFAIEVRSGTGDPEQPAPSPS
jgi:hypothetical protein